MVLQGDIATDLCAHPPCFNRSAHYVFPIGGLVLVTEMAVISENKRNNGNTR